MKLITSFCLVSLLITGYSQDADLNRIVGQIQSVYSIDLDSDITYILYKPDSIIPNEQVTPILYIFGDFLFETFSGSINYLLNELSLIPNCILIGINEISEKQIGHYQQEYSDFIVSDLMDTLSANYNFSDKGILFGHSRATRLVAQVIQENPEYINQFILSAPWLTEQHLKELDKALSNKSEMISVFYTQSKEDMTRPAIQEANENLTDVLHKYQNVVRAKYQFFDDETHMSIPPLSFYYGVKYLLQ